jgi:hypothetical protein
MFQRLDLLYILEIRLEVENLIPVTTVITLGQREKLMSLTK